MKKFLFFIIIFYYLKMDLIESVEIKKIIFYFCGFLFLDFGFVGFVYFELLPRSTIALRVLNT